MFHVSRKCIIKCGVVLQEYAGNLNFLQYFVNRKFKILAQGSMKHLMPKFLYEHASNFYLNYTLSRKKWIP